jgi:glutamate racemase
MTIPPGNPGPGAVRAGPEQNAGSPETCSLPIGVFDSGVGGLTVLKALRLALPGEDLVYLGDTARLPYGTKSPASIARYACQATRHLQAQGIKLLVVACNTASAVALDALREQMAPLPVIGVVEPGASAAVSGRAGASHLVLATAATVRLGAYRRAIALLDAAAEIRELACELLVSLAEEGWTDGDIATAIVERYLGQLPAAERAPDCVILGCTHFPLLKDTIAAVLPPGTAIVDSAGTTARAARQLLQAEKLMNPNAAGTLRLYATDGATRFARVGGRFLGEPLDAADITLVDL